MNVDRAEQTGFGVAVGGHLVLLGALYIGFTSPPPLPMPRQPMEVQLVDEIGLESGAPELSSQPPAPKLGEIEATPEPLPPEPAPTPAPPQPKATPQPKVVPQPKAAPPQPKTRPKQKTARPAGRLAGILEGIGDTDSTSRSTKAPAATVTPAVQSALAAEVRRQIKAHWDGPNGPDVDKIRTVLRISLARDGTATNIEWVETTGVNDTNRGLAQLHRERAIKAVRLASPFKLPAQFYEGWKAINVSFDWRLSQ